MASKVSTPNKRQINLRLPSQVVDVLEAIAFLDRKSSLQEVVSDLVRTHVEARSREYEVQGALRLRAEYEGKRVGKIQRLSDRQSNRKKGG